MALEVYALPEHSETPSVFPTAANVKVVKRDISDSAGSNNKLAEVGDKVQFCKLPQYARVTRFWFWNKGLDTNASASTSGLTLKGQINDGVTEHVLIPAGTVEDSGAEQYREADQEPLGDIFDVAEASVEIEVTVAAATAGTTGCEVAIGIEYYMARDEHDPA